MRNDDSQASQATAPARGTLEPTDRLNKAISRVLQVVRQRPTLSVAVLAGPAILWVVAFVIAPAIFMILMSLWTYKNYHLVHDWTLSNYTRVLSQALFTHTLWRSVKIASIVTVCSVALALPVSYVIVFKIRRRKTLWFGAVIVALWVGYLLRIYAWRIVLGRNGVLNGILQATGIVDEPVSAFLFSDFAMVLALTHLCTPFALVPIYSVLAQVPKSLLEAANDLYAPRARTFFGVTLPLAAHGVVAGASFAFILSFGDFYAPQLIGGPQGSLIANVASTQFGGTFQWNVGAALGMVMFVVVMMVLAVPGVITSSVNRRRGGGSLLPRVKQDPV